MWDVYQRGESPKNFRVGSAAAANPPPPPAEGRLPM